jgi:putative endonuclease
MDERQYYVYIISNDRNTVLYIGVTNDLIRRVHEHRMHLVSGFSSRYNLHKLVHFEACGDVLGAIAREKQLKGGSRQQKIALVASMNPEWCDLVPTRA